MPTRLAVRYFMLTWDIRNVSVWRRLNRIPMVAFAFALWAAPKAKRNDFHQLFCGQRHHGPHTGDLPMLDNRLLIGLEDLLPMECCSYGPARIFFNLPQTKPG